MADLFFSGDALLVTNVQTGTLTAYDVATTYKVTIGGKVVSTLGTGGNTTTTATALVALLNASTYPEFAEITWTSSTNTVIGTCDTPGKSFTAVLSVTGGTGTITDFAQTTANDGPQAVTANNFKNSSTGARALPTGSDTLTLEASAVNLYYNLDGLAAVTPTATYIKASYTGQAGLNFYNTDAADAVNVYQEYRVRYLTLNGSTALVIGEGDGSGSPRLMLNLKAVQSAVLVNKTGNGSDGYKAVILKGTHASNTLKIESGEVDIAPFAGETATFLTVDATGDSKLRTSIGTTLGTVNCDDSAEVEIFQVAALADVTAINIRGSASCTIRGDNAVTAITMDGTAPTLTYEGSGTVTTLNLYAGAVLDCTDNPTGFTVTTVNVYGPCTINDPNGKLTVTNAIANGSQVKLNLSPKRGLTLGSP